MPAPDIEGLAAEWLIRLEDDPSATTRIAFNEWLAADPRHHAAFVRLQKTWSRADALRRLRPLDGNVDENVLDKFERPAINLEPESAAETPRAPETPAQPTRRRMFFGIAAAFVLVTAGALTWLAVSRGQWQTYRTEFGGFQRIALQDGSTALLNTDSQIRVRFTDHRRQILLERGEALFTVAHDVTRPFDVSAEDTVVRAVGTAFSVRIRDQKQVDVIVTEGRVAIDPPDDSRNSQLPESVALPTLSTLSAGETVSVSAHRVQRKTKIADDDLTKKLAWTQGRIWFDRATLAEAVAEFNRYNRRQLVIDDPSIAGLHIGGAFDATDLDSFVAALQSFAIRSAPGTHQSGKADEIHLAPAENAR